MTATYQRRNDDRPNIWKTMLGFPRRFLYYSLIG